MRFVPANRGWTFGEPSTAAAKSRRYRNIGRIGVLLLLAGAIQASAQRKVVVSSLVLQIRPEELLQAQSGNVLLKIRLAPGTTARLWAANACQAPSPPSQVITVSGRYTIPFSAFTPGSGAPSQQTRLICLLSSDGTLRDSVPAGISGTRHSSGTLPSAARSGSSGVSVAVPAGIVVTRQGATSTWSNP